MVSWLGGEPLLWPQLSRVSEILYGELSLSLGITTNGMRLHLPEVCSLLARRFEQLTVSIDGFADFHDRVRQAPGSFAHIRSALKDYLAHHAPPDQVVRVNTVLMRGNIDQFETFCEEIASWGVRELSWNQLGGNDRPEFYPANRLLPEQVRTFATKLPSIRARMKSMGLRIVGSEQYLRRIEATAENRLIAVADCDPGDTFLFIDEQFRASPCSFTSQAYGIPLDQFESAESVARLPSLYRQLREKERASPCADCHATHVYSKFQIPQIVPITSNPISVSCSESKERLCSSNPS